MPAAALVVLPKLNPAAIVLAGEAKLLPAVESSLPAISYFLFAIGFLLAWRFHQTGMRLCAWPGASAYWTVTRRDFDLTTVSGAVLPTSYLKKKTAPTDKAWGDEKAQHICNM